MSAPTVVGYAFPWDVIGDDRALERFARVGIDELMVAASYHETRAATPLHPRHTIIRARHAAYYGRIEPQAWGRLIPPSPAWMGEPDSFGSAYEAAAGAGMPVSAWIVLTHNAELGARYPDLCIVNAWGDCFEWALCPTSPDVVEYACTLVTETLSGRSLAGAVLESAGPMGVDHRGAYDKTDLAGWTVDDRALLSLCFCRSCLAAYAEAGIDARELSDRVRSGDSVHPAVVEAFRVRLQKSSDFAARVLAAARAAAPHARLTLHGNPAARSAGPFAPVSGRIADSVDSLVVSGWDPTAIGGLLESARALAPSRRLGLYVRPEFESPALDGLGVSPDELHLYHLGLCGEVGLASLAGLASTFRSRTAALR